MCRLQASRIVRPVLRQIERPIDEGMAVTRHIGSKHADLAIGDLARRTSVLARYPARCLALLQKAGLIDHQNRVLVASVSSAYSRTISRNASASHRPRPKIACCRHGPGSPAASARIHPVLRGSSPNSPSRNCPAEAATRSCVNNGRIRCLPLATTMPTTQRLFKPTHHQSSDPELWSPIGFRNLLNKKATIDARLDRPFLWGQLLRHHLGSTN